MWLHKMYKMAASQAEDAGDYVPDYETVKFGGVFQALFFDAYVKAFFDNVLKGHELYGKMEWGWRDD